MGSCYAARRLPPGHGGPGTQYFTFDDEDAAALQERELQRIVVYVDAPSLDVPALQWDEEANAFLLAPLLHSQEQVIVQEIPAVPVASSLVRAVQPADVEQVLDVPVLITDDDDPGISSDELDRMLVQCDIRKLLVARSPGLFGSRSFVEQVVDVPVQHRVQYAPSSGSGYMEQVVGVPVPLLFPPAVSSGFDSLEQVVDVPVPHRVHAPLSDVSEEVMEQVVDVPGSFGHGSHAHAPRSAGFSAVFSHFSPKQKSATTGRQSSAPLGAHSSSSAPAAHGPDDLVFPRLLIWHSDDTFFCRGDVWCVRLDPSLQKYYFFRKDEGRSQWQPPWLP